MYVSAILPYHLSPSLSLIYYSLSPVYISPSPVYVSPIYVSPSLPYMSLPYMSLPLSRICLPPPSPLYVSPSLPYIDVSLPYMYLPLPPICLSLSLICLLHSFLFNLLWSVQLVVTIVFVLDVSENGGTQPSQINRLSGINLLLQLLYHFLIITLIIGLVPSVEMCHT